MKLLSAREVAAQLSVSRPSLYVWMRDHGLPRPLKIGGRRLWVEDELVAWIVQRQEARGG